MEIVRHVGFKMVFVPKDAYKRAHFWCFLALNIIQSVIYINVNSIK